MTFPDIKHSITIKNLNFGYGQRQILDHIDLTVAGNDFAALIGPSGCGKSTLLRLLAGLAQSDTGSIAIDGQTVTGPGLDRAVVFQDYSLFPWMSCGENIVLALRQASPRLARREARILAGEFLGLVGLDGEFDKLPGKLSGGMRQRAAIARAFAVNAPILLMDEPFGALDAITRAKLQDLLLNMWQTGGDTGKTVVFVTHDVDEALLLANRIFILGVNPGRIVRELEVTLPRPRIRDQLLENEEFQRLRAVILRELDQVVLAKLENDHGDNRDGNGI